MINAILASLPYILICLAVAYFGQDRKFGFWGNFAASLVLTPIAGLVILLAQEKKAPKCAEATEAA